MEWSKMSKNEDWIKENGEISRGGQFYSNVILFPSNSDAIIFIIRQVHFAEKYCCIMIRAVKVCTFRETFQCQNRPRSFEHTKYKRQNKVIEWKKGKNHWIKISMKYVSSTQRTANSLLISRISYNVTNIWFGCLSLSLY